MIHIDGNGVFPSPALILHCLLKCSREGRECMDIYAAESELQQLGPARDLIPTLGGRPLHGLTGYKCGSLLFHGSDGFILELDNLASPMLPQLFASTLRQGLDTLPDAPTSREN